VTTFTASDFGRTLSSNGEGSDHGWGSHHLVLGGSVLGKDFYGTMPDLALDGPDDSGNGRLIPTQPVPPYPPTLPPRFPLRPPAGGLVRRAAGGHRGDLPAARQLRFGRSRVLGLIRGPARGRAAREPSLADGWRTRASAGTRCAFRDGGRHSCRCV